MTVKQFLADIRAFQNRVTDRKNQTKNTRQDSTDDEDEIDSSTDHRVSPSLDVNEYVRGFVRQLLEALMILHDNEIVHCDVKGDNIFIALEKGHYIVKLGVSFLMKTKK